MFVKKSVLLATTALAMMFASPTYAAGVLIDQEVDPVNVIMDASQSQVMNQPASSLSQVLMQIGVNLYHGVGNPNIPNSLPLSYVGFGSDWEIRQFSGGPLGAPPAGTPFTVNLTAHNTNTVSNVAFPALATVIAGGSQQGYNSVNYAYIAPVALFTAAVPAVPPAPPLREYRQYRHYRYRGADWNAHTACGRRNSFRN